MSNHLINTAMSGLTAARCALSTASNNITNVNVDGYHRQNTIFAQNHGTMTSVGFIGNGVVVAGVNREYSEFITHQLRSAQTQSSGLEAYCQQVAQIDNLLADQPNTLSTTLQDFFSNLQYLASHADDDAARKTVIDKARGLVNQFQSVDKHLRDMDSHVNQKVRNSVVQINHYTAQIATLNDQITRIRGSSSNEPNALLDQHDQLITTLNQIVDISVTQQDGNAYNISFAGGLPLVQGAVAYRVAAIPASSDANRVTLGYQRSSGEVTEVEESRITVGSLGRDLKFRSEALASARNQLGQIALTLADNINQQHRAGFDINGQPGGDFFSFTGPQAVSNSKNTGSATLSGIYTDTRHLQASDYRLEYNGTQWQVIRLTDHAKITATVGTSASGKPSLSFNGLAVSIDGKANKHDSFTITTVNHAASNLKVIINDTGKIAAAGAAHSGVSDNRNARALLNLQTKKCVEDKATFSGAYARLLSHIGNQTSTAKVNSAAQKNIVTQLTAEQQSKSGVNLDEEYGDLQRLQHYYLANARVIQTAATLFNALIGIRN